MIIVYSTYKTERLNYVLNFCFSTKGIDFELTDDLDHFSASSKIKINYSKDVHVCDLNIKNHGLLFASNINSKHDVFYDNNLWFIDKINDPFAIIFFFLTCYEEYYINNRDEHDRFSAKQSTLFKQNRLDKPNVDLIVKQLWQILNLNYLLVKNSYNENITFDIDMAWAHKNKSIWRNLGGDLLSILKRESLNNKRQVRQGKIKDPFDTFDLIKEIAQTNNVTCFFLLGKWGKYDKNINWKNERLQTVIQLIKEDCNVGIHPSYNSYLNSSIIGKEIQNLRQIINKEVTKSRQHFLKIKLPKSYQLLIENGIKEDYSMGFADAYGFRSGTCFQYLFFDLSTNKTTDLLIHPITYMDSTLNHYMKLSIEESIEIIKTLKQEVKNVGGTFTPLWHNETIGEHGNWKGWLGVFNTNIST